MVIRALVTGGALGLGVWLVLRGYFAPRPTLADRLRAFGETAAFRPKRHASEATRWDDLAMWVLRVSRADLLDDVSADVAVAGGSLEKHAVEKLQAGVGGGVLAAVLPFMLGFVGSYFALVVLFIIGAAVCYLIPDVELKRKAAERRVEFAEALTAFVSLAAVSISGGGGLQTALHDAVAVGTGWPFEQIRRSLAESALQNVSPWTGFERLGRDLNLVPMIELAGALALAGAGGAPVTETLQARAEAGRSREISDARAAAEKKSASLGLPIGVMLLGWIGFMAYPAVLNLLST